MQDHSFSAIFGRYVAVSQYTAGQLSLLSGVPKRTIVNWIEGRVRRPRQWQPLLQVAAVLHLSRSEVDELLRVAGHASLWDLQKVAVAVADQQLVQTWPDVALAPFQVIPETPGFVGRKQLVKRLMLLLQSGQYVTICHLRGMGGVGKTTLAARVAYLLRPYFQDGVLWARLDTSDTMTILNTFARAYGEDVTIYHDVESRAAAVRGILSSKHVLMVLDNAESSEQVRPLLPPNTGRTAVIVTTRHDLSVADKMQRLIVDMFDEQEDEALSLFAYYLGAQQAAFYRQELQQIADLLGHLPLAVAIAAGRLAYGGLTPPDFLRELQQERRRLDVLVREDSSVRLSFDWSYKNLPSEGQRFFAMLGVFGGKDFDTTAVAHVTELTAGETDRYLQLLQGISLVQKRDAGRYGLHPLLRDYVREKLALEPIWNVAYGRMIIYFVQYGQAHYRQLLNLDVEEENLMAALTEARQRDMPLCFIDGVNALAYFWVARGLYAQAQRYLHDAYRLAVVANDNGRLGRSHYHLGLVLHKQGELEAAEVHLQQAWKLVGQTADELTLIDCLILLGSINEGRGDAATASDYWQDALQRTRGLGLQQQETAVLINLGALHANQNQLALAEDYYLQGVRLAQEIDHKQAMVELYGNSGELLELHGRMDEALDFYRRGAELAYQLRLPERISWLLRNWGQILVNRGDLAAAEVHFVQAREAAQKINNIKQLSLALAALGYLHCYQLRLPEAEPLLHTALGLAISSGVQSATNLVLIYMGLLAYRQGDYKQVQDYLQEAIDQCQQSRDVLHEGQAWYYYGYLCGESAEWEKAEEAYRQAYHLGQQYEMPFVLACARFGLAQVAAHKGKRAQAVQLAEQSLAQWEAWEFTFAQVVRQWLEEYGSGGERENGGTGEGEK